MDDNTSTLASPQPLMCTHGWSVSAACSADEPSALLESREPPPPPVSTAVWRSDVSPTDTRDPSSPPSSARAHDSDVAARITCSVDRLDLRLIGRTGRTGRARLCCGRAQARRGVSTYSCLRGT
eukprot:3384223-Prymnesium_polylepis.1